MKSRTPKGVRLFNIKLRREEMTAIARRVVPVPVDLCIINVKKFSFH